MGQNTKDTSRKSFKQAATDLVKENETTIGKSRRKEWTMDHEELQRTRSYFQRQSEKEGQNYQEQDRKERSRWKN